MRVHLPCKVHVPCIALGLTLAATMPAAHAQTMYDAAQTVVAPQPVVIAPAPTAVITAPVPLRTVRTVTTTTTRTVRRWPLARRRVTVTRHTSVKDHVVPATTTTTTTVATVPAPYVIGPLYDAAAPPPATVEPYDTMPLYDTMVQTPAPAIIPATTAIVAPVGGAVPAYRYVYQRDRILVIDPDTGIAVQAIPR